MGVAESPGRCGENQAMKISAQWKGSSSTVGHLPPSQAIGLPRQWQVATLYRGRVPVVYSQLLSESLEVSIVVCVKESFGACGPVRSGSLLLLTSDLLLSLSICDAILLVLGRTFVLLLIGSQDGIDCSRSRSGGGLPMSDISNRVLQTVVLSPSRSRVAIRCIACRTYVWPRTRTRALLSRRGFLLLTMMS
jgi:hypothetical protein